MRSSRPPVKKMIFASSPPSSMTASVSGSRQRTHSAVEYTSCTKDRRAALAMPSPAEPDTATVKLRPSRSSLIASIISSVFWRT